MSEAPKTVWVTEWALESGVEECRVAHIYDDGSLDLEEGCAPALAEHCHPTREAALTRANEMRAAKIASLKRQIEKLEALEF